MIFLMIIVFIGCVDAMAQTRSLEECISLALNNNAYAQNSALDMQAADYRIREIKSALLPSVDMTGQYMYYRDVPAQYAPASAFGGPEGQYNKLSLNMKQTTTANLQFTQSLYNQSVITGVKAAKVVKEASALQLKLTQESITYNVSATYYTIQVLNDNLKRLEVNIGNLEKTVQINESLRQHELIAVNQYNRMVINLENLKNQYASQKLLREKNVSLLKHWMNQEMDQPLEVAPFEAEIVADSVVLADLANRTDLRLQKAQVKLSEYDKKSVQAGYYPMLVSTNYFGVTSFYDDFAPLKQINDDWIRSSYFALTIKVPVFDGFRKQNQVRQKEIAVRQNMNTYSRMRSGAEKELADAANLYETNLALVKNNRKSLDLAEELFTSSQQEFENGITSSTEFLNAQNDLSNARTNYSTALLNLRIAELDLKKANGTLLLQ